MNWSDLSTLFWVLVVPFVGGLILWRWSIHEIKVQRELALEKKPDWDLVESSNSSSLSLMTNHALLGRFAISRDSRIETTVIFRHKILPMESLSLVVGENLGFNQGFPEMRLTHFQMITIKLEGRPLPFQIIDSSNYLQIERLRNHQKFFSEMFSEGGLFVLDGNQCTYIVAIEEFQPIEARLQKFTEFCKEAGRLFAT